MPRIDRRVFLGRAGAYCSAAAALSLGPARLDAAKARVEETAARGIPANWKSIRKIDVHMHVYDSEPRRPYGTADDVIEAADALGIEKLCTSIPTSQFAPPEAIRAANDMVLAAMGRHPGRILGYCFLIPSYQETLAELDRCLDAGMIGVKLYNQHKYSDPVVFPLVERCIERRVPILGHAGHVNDERNQKRQPNISDAAVFCALAHRYPEAVLIHAHVHGGGDWEWTIKRLRDCPNVYLDTSGSVLDEGAIAMAVEILGHERVLFGTDTSMETAVGKILSAELTAPQREDIFWRNMQGILDRRKT